MKRHHDTTRNDSDRIRSHLCMSFALFSLSLSLSFHRRDQSSLDHNTDYAHHHRSMKRRKYSDCVRYISVCLLLFFTLSLSLSSQNRAIITSSDGQHHGRFRKWCVFLCAYDTHKPLCFSEPYLESPDVLGAGEHDDNMGDDVLPDYEEFTDEFDLPQHSRGVCM